MRPPRTPSTATADTMDRPNLYDRNPSSVAIAVAKTVDCTTCGNGWPAPGSVASEIDLSNSVTCKPTPWLEPRHRPSINPAEKAAGSSAARPNVRRGHSAASTALSHAHCRTGVRETQKAA